MTKLLDKNNYVLSISERQTILTDTVISNEDPYDKLFLSMKDEVWYWDNFED